VLVITKGDGAIAIGGGTIDVLGYGPGGRPAESPEAALAELAPDHPYARVGKEAVEEALRFFLGLCQEEGLPYTGSLGRTQWIPTAIGTLKPSCLAPRTMGAESLEAAAGVLVVGFHGLKDYNPELIVRGLERVPGHARRYRVAMLDAGLSATGRDVTALDLARGLDQEPRRRALGEALRKEVQPGEVVLLPPVLGSRPSYQVLDEMEKAVGCRIVETVGLPPAVTGLRLLTLLLGHLRKRRVRIIEQATVARAEVEGGACRAVITYNGDRERTYPARSVILATGGFYGGGMEASVGSARESIFGLPIRAPKGQEEWGQARLFGGGPQPFARLGLEVDAELRPVGEDGRPVLENVRAVGRNLAGYDDGFEKSGNGVAVVTGHRAGILA
jgi:glycerol-3-phosphate dehydrogenase subunit B